MTAYYDVQNKNGTSVWIAAHENEGEHRMFAWLPNTRRWHHHFDLERDFYGLDRDLQFAPITPEDAAKQICHRAPLNLTKAGWIVNTLSAAKSVTSRELGLPRAMSAKRPTTDQQLIEELRSATGVWVAIYEYPSQDIGAARVMASDIRRGRRKHFAGLGGLEARTRPEGDTIVVEARTTP